MHILVLFEKLQFLVSKKSRYSRREIVMINHILLNNNIPATNLIKVHFLKVYSNTK